MCFGAKLGNTHTNYYWRSRTIARAGNSATKVKHIQARTLKNNTTVCSQKASTFPKKPGKHVPHDEQQTYPRSDRDYYPSTFQQYPTSNPSFKATIVPRTRQWIHYIISITKRGTRRRRTIFSRSFRNFYFYFHYQRIYSPHTYPLLARQESNRTEG
jgi:hypothetical protein